MNVSKRQVQMSQAANGDIINGSRGATPCGERPAFPITNNKFGHVSITRFSRSRLVAIALASIPTKILNSEFKSAGKGETTLSQPTDVVPQ